jgi:uncharacterized protein YpmB
VNRRWRQIGAVLALVAMVIFASGSFWYWLQNKAVSAAIQERAADIVQRHPELQAAWEKALEDQVLNQSEAQEIAKAAGESLEPQPQP